MATDITQLVGHARDAQRTLIERGMVAEAQIIEDLVNELATLSPQIRKGFYTAPQAASIIGVSSQTIKNWVARGILQGYKLGGRVIIPLTAVESYRMLASLSKGIEPLPAQDELVEEIRRGRRPIEWPRETEEKK